MNNFAQMGIDNIQRVRFDKFEKDFSFIVNGEIYQTNSFVANILSPYISKNFEKGMKLSYHEIHSKYEGDFNRIIEYGEMKMINIKEEEKKYFENIMKELGNNKECFVFSQEFSEDISIENVVQRIKTKSELDINSTEEITFISSNFHDIYTKYPEEIFTLDIDIIERILSNVHLKLSKEEELFDIILQLYQKSKEYSTLFSYVIFINLSRESILKFKENFDINDINQLIWANICSRLEQDISDESIETYQKSHEEFLANRYVGERYEHIIQHLREECQGNVHTQNIVNITSSSTFFSCKAENVVEQNDSICFQSDNEVNSWIKFDFKARKVLLDHYTLKTYNSNANLCHLKNWILEVSNDGENYTEIDRHENCELLNGNLKTATFKVSCSTPQRFVRLKQIGPNRYGDNYLTINEIEFSGFLLE